MNSTDHPARRDLLALLILAIFCLALRVPSLGRAVLNPDESQYEATASYLVATGKSTFAFPYGTPGTFALYSTMARLFGPYSMFEMRTLVLLICLIMSVLLYLLVSRETDRWSGVAAAVVFLHYNLFFEGLTANREWFAGFSLMIGVFVFWVSGRHGPAWRFGLLLISGAACGSALWFKLQASFMLLAVPLVLLVEAIQSRSLRELVRGILPYGLGGLLAVGMYLFAFLLNGTASEYLGSIVSDWFGFVQESESATRTANPNAFLFYFKLFYFHLPHRPILLVAYAAAVSSLVVAVRDRLLTKEPQTPEGFGRSAVLLFAIYLLTAMLCVKLGGRFFPHYYLFMMPAVAALCGFALHSIRRLARSSHRRNLLLWSLIASVYLLDRLLVSRDLIRSLLSGEGHGIDSVVTGVYLLLLVLTVGLVVAGPRRAIRLAVVAALCLELGFLTVRAQTRPTPRSMYFERWPYTTLVREIGRISRPDDRLFVWGWTPEVYSLTRLESASHITVAQYIVNDYHGRVGPPTIDSKLESVLMEDLSQRQPRFIVDCADRTRWSTRPGVYQLQLYPDFGLVRLLNERYSRWLSADGCDIHVRTRPP